MVTAPYRIELECDLSEPRLALRGWIDAVAAPALQETIAVLADIRRPVHLDLGAVEYLDAEGVEPLLRLSANRAEPFVITAASPAAAQAIGSLDLPPTVTVVGEPRSNGPVDGEAPAELAGPWPVAVLRQLRDLPSTEAVMERACGLARSLLGCSTAALIAGKARELERIALPNKALLAAVAADCLAAEENVIITNPTERPARVPRAEPEPFAVVAWYLPNGAGRRPAALALTFASELTESTLADIEDFAVIADAALAHKHADEQVASLRAALKSNRDIGTAIGIVMATRQINDAQAFSLLRSASQRTQRKLSVIAAEVVYSGRLPS